MFKRGTLLVLALIMILSIPLAGCNQEAVPSVGNDQEKNEEVDVVDSKEEQDSDSSSETNDSKEDDQKVEKDNQQEEKDEETSDKKDEEAKESEKENNTVYISASKLNVRAEGSTKGDIIGSVIKGAPVKILDELSNETGEATWYRVEFDNGKEKTEGWISAKYTVEDKMDLLGEGYKELDLSPVDKPTEYEGNPRVEVKGVYVTIHSAAGKRLDDLIKLANETDINAFVIDVKDDNGNLLFATETAAAENPEANKKVPIKDIEEFMKKLKDNNIYTIARIVSFKDPKLAKRYPERAIVYRSNGKPFTNRDNIVWLSAYNRDTWKYNIEISKEAAKVGFDEIQFDYVRFPASNGGKMDKYLDYKNEKNESKPVAIQRYLKYAREELSPLGIYISADIYGLVGSVADDMGIGQYWEAVSNYVDYVCPMMYPSHYGSGVYGLSVPDAYPYETINIGARDANLRNKNIETPAIIRPWIQDFTATWVKGHIRYGDEEVRAQIKALEDNGIKEYLLWNPANRYSEGGVK